MSYERVRLTPREAQVAALIVHGGLSSKEIGKRLNISDQRVREHVVAIGKKVPGFGKPRHKITVFFLTVDSSEPNP